MGFDCLRKFIARTRNFATKNLKRYKHYIQKPFVCLWELQTWTEIYLSNTKMCLSSFFGDFIFRDCQKKLRFERKETQINNKSLFFCLETKAKLRKIWNAGTRAIAQQNLTTNSALLPNIKAELRLREPVDDLRKYEGDINVFGPCSGDLSDCWVSCFTIFIQF